MLILNIQGAKISLPQKWSELTEKQYIFVVEQLLLHLIGKIDPVELRLRVLMYITSYKDVSSLRMNKLKYLFNALPLKVKRKFNLLSANQFGTIIELLRDKYLAEDRGLIDYNLIKLSECLDFLMDETLLPEFTSNPVKKIKGVGVGRFFNVGIINVTDLTAGNFANAMDIIDAYSESKEVSLLDWLIALTYGKSVTQFTEISQQKLNQISKIPFSVKYGVYLWYVSLSNYLSKHPVYSLLYNKQPASNDEKISLGMSEAISKLAQSGYGSNSELRQYDLIRFMDLQISDLKRNLKEAVSAGIELSKISESTGLSISQINMLT